MTHDERKAGTLIVVGLAIALAACAVLTAAGCGEVTGGEFDAGRGGTGGTGGAGGRGGAGGAAGASSGGAGGQGGAVDAGDDARPVCPSEVIGYDLACSETVDGVRCYVGCLVRDDAGVSTHGPSGCTSGAHYCAPAGVSCGAGCL